MTAFASQLFAHVLRHSFSAWLLVSALAVMLPVTWQWLQLPADLSGWLGSYGQWLSLPWLTVLLLVVVVVTARQRNMPQDMSHTLYSAPYRASPDAVGITSIKDGRFIDVNPALCNMLGLPREQIIGRTNAELQVYATPEERVRLLDELASKGQVHRLRILCLSHGEIVPGTISAVLVEFDSEPCMFFIFHDMRDYEKAVDQLHSANRLLQQAGHLAQLGAWEDRRGQGLVYWSDVCYDIHGVPRNSPLSRDYLSTFVAPEHREHMRRQLMGIAYLDLDGFKPINDRLGHAAGDRLLVLVAKRLQHAMRSNDCAARFGGDEFVLLLNPLNSRAECEAMLQRIMHSISRPYALDGEQVLVTASIGYTLSPDDSSDADTLIRHADQAMYQAKQSGRNRIEAFDANEDRSQRENHIKGQRILQGLHHHEFVLHVQPKVDMQSGQVIGVEALARWQHPQQGLLTPQHFLPHIEGGELELAFGQWSITQALDILEDFQQQGLSLPVAVNLSPTHLQHSHFTQWMASQLQAHPRIPPRLLDLEITENAALHDMQKMSQVLKALRALGLNISLDDFVVPATPPSPI